MSFEAQQFLIWWNIICLFFVTYEFGVTSEELVWFKNTKIHF